MDTTLLRHYIRAGVNWHRPRSVSAYPELKQHAHVKEQALLRRYNDKPLLTRPQQRFFLTPEYLEIDLDVHNYAYLARKVLSPLASALVLLQCAGNVQAALLTASWRSGWWVSSL
jgi:Protein ENHANCED DISEASE RESISTANCE 2, C-terminal